MRQADYETLADFRYHLRSFLRFSENAARVARLTPQQHQLLLALKGLPSTETPTVSVLATRLHLRHHTTVELANRLQKRSYILRKPDPRDGRRVLLLLTQKGEHVLENLSVIHRKELQSAAPLLIDTLRKLIHEKRKTSR